MTRPIIAALVAQTFYAYRILIISENKIIPAIIMLVSNGLLNSIVPLNYNYLALQMSLISFIGAIVITEITKQAGTFDSVQAHTLRTSIFIGVRSAYSIFSNTRCSYFLRISLDLGGYQLCL